MIQVSDVEQARKRISTILPKPTPFLAHEGLSAALGCELWFKYENMNVTGSFKIRGAANKFLAEKDTFPKAGIVAASAGNHAQGVAWMARHTGTKSTIVMPEATPLVKVQNTRNLGAEVVLHGESFDEAYAKARILEKDKGTVFVHPFDDPMIMAGQGTAALEMTEHGVPIDVAVIPIGGGGLMGGMATVLKKAFPKIHIVGVQTSRSPNVGRMVLDPKAKPEAIHGATIAEGIAVKHPSARVATFLKDLVDEVVFLEEREIAAAVLTLLEKAKTVAEGAGAAALGALLSGKFKPKAGARVATVISGGNADAVLLGSILERGLSLAGRLCGLKVVAADRPGNLQKICEVIAGQRANILQVYHHRDSPGIELDETEIEVHMETRGPDHVEKIVEALQMSHFRSKRLF